MQGESKRDDKLSSNVPSHVPSSGHLLQLDPVGPSFDSTGSAVRSHIDELSSLFATATIVQQDDQPKDMSLQTSFLSDSEITRTIPNTEMHEMDDFGDFMDTDMTGANSTASHKRSIPPPHVLLPLFSSGIWSTIPSFLSLLTPLDYPLRRRVLSHAKTKEYVEGVKESARVAGRVMAGRTVRSSLPRATKEARETERVWHDLLPRVRAVAGHDMPVLRADRTVSLDVVGQACVLCGVSKEVKLGFREGRGGEMLNADGIMWHRSCRAWWCQEETRLSLGEK